MNNAKISMRLIFAIESIIFLLFAFVIIYQIRNPQEITVSLDDLQSDYAVYDGQWKIDGTDFEFEEPIKLLSSSGISVGAGSYTLALDYQSEKQLKCNLSSAEEGVFVHANQFALSRNKNHVTYDFFVTRNVSDLCLEITDYSSGDFSLSEITISSNANNAKILLFLFVIFCVVLNIFLFAFPVLNADFKTSTLMIFGITFCVSIPVFIDGISFGHDLLFHLGRIEGIAKGLSQGDFPVRMNKFFMDGYGYPVSVFYGDALLYIPAVLRLIGFSVVSAYKIYVVVINLLTTANCFVCAKAIFKNLKTATLVAFAYSASSFRLVDIWTRAAVGEYTAFVFLPILALAVWNIYTQDIKDKTYIRNALLLALGMLGLIYTHILTTVMAVVVLAGIAIAFIKLTIRKETIVVYALAVITFVVAGSAFIIPFIDYYINTDTRIKEFGQTAASIQAQGAYLSDYFSFFKNVTGNSGTVVADRMQFSPGVILMIGLVVSICLTLSGKATRRIKVFLLGALIMLFISSNIFPWNQIAASFYLGNMLAAIQFPWRYLGFANMFLALLLGETVECFVKNEKVDNKIYFILDLFVFISICIFLSSFSSWTSPQNRYIDSAELAQYPGGDYSATNGYEYLLYGTNVNNIDNIIYAENGTASLHSEDGLDMRVKTTMGDDGSIVLPRFNYPNYIAVDENGNNFEITSGDNNRICILFNEAYDGIVQIKYVNPWYWRFADIVSLLSFVAMLMYGICIINMNKKGIIND